MQRKNQRITEIDDPFTGKQREKVRQLEDKLDQLMKAVKQGNQ
jgi:hypothetical protein